jgi:NH3-dependent NAD+ synthetase
MSSLLPLSDPALAGCTGMLSRDTDSCDYLITTFQQRQRFTVHYAQSRQFGWGMIGTKDVGKWTQAAYRF